MKKYFVMMLVGLALMSALVGCGGSGSGSDVNYDSPTACTYYWDATVDGLGRPRNPGNVCDAYSYTKSQCLSDCANRSDKTNCQWHPGYVCK